MRDPRFTALSERSPGRPTPSDEIEQARTLGRDIALGPVEAKTLERTDSALKSFTRELWTIFLESFSNVVLEDEQRRCAWVELLVAETARILDDREELIRLTRLDARELDNQASNWRAQTDPFAVLVSSKHVYLSYVGGRAYYYLSMLLHVDSPAWCNAIDAMPFPAIMKMAIYHVFINEDRELIEDLLRIAPTIVDVHGNWVESRSVVALLVSWAIIQHAGDLHQAVSALAASSATGSELQKLEDQELPAWMRQAFQTVLERVDGRAIALGLLGRLAAEAFFGTDTDPGGRWSASRQALDTLAAVLKSAGIAALNVHDAWVLQEARVREKQERERNRRRRRQPDSHRFDEDEGEGARTLHGDGLPMLLGAAAMYEQHPASACEADQLWCWFEELLVGRDPSLSMLHARPSGVQIMDRLGLLLSRTSDPEAFFRSTYLRLEPQRRRALFEFRYKGFDHNHTSTLLLSVGLYAAAHRISRAESTGAVASVRALFWWIYEAARRLWLTSSHHNTEREEQRAVARCFAFMPRLFGDTLGDALRRAVPPVANDARLVGLAGWYLWKNGLDLARLVPALHEADADISRALLDAHQWSRLVEDHPRFRAGNPEFPAALMELAAELHLSFDNSNAEPLPPDELPRRRAEFMRAITWGDPLLRRLKQDGCSPTRIVRLDAAGSIWLIQAATPSLLRDRFGLSPEIRLLAVHGQVRGRDLRMALQDPGGNERVDLDLIVVAGDQPEFTKRLRMLAGPWGQRIPWPPLEGAFIPLADALREHLPAFDLFDYRDPVRGSALIGRRAETEDITTRLLRGEAVGVVGLRKVGKSSLLRAVAERIDPIGARRGMFEFSTVPLPGDADLEALVISLDVQGVAGRGLSVLVDRLCTIFQERLTLAGIRADPDQDPGTMDPLDRLRGVLNLALARTRLPICFLLDEYDLLFEGYSGEPGIPGIERLLSLLRAEAQSTRRVSLALIGRDPVFLEKPLMGGFTNPLAGWARPIFVGALRREEADELLVQLGKRMDLDVGPATLEAAWRWTGGHPLLLRQYGSALLELAYTPPSRSRPVPTDPIHDDIVEMFLLRDAVHTICTEIHALLEARFPEALTLVQALARATGEEAHAVVTRHGGTRSRAYEVLLRFGIVAEDAAGPWTPGTLRDWFAPSVEPPVRQEHRR